MVKPVLNFIDNHKVALRVGGSLLVGTAAGMGAFVFAAWMLPHTVIGIVATNYIALPILGGALGADFIGLCLIGATVPRKWRIKKETAPQPAVSDQESDKEDKVTRDAKEIPSNKRKEFTRQVRSFRTMASENNEIKVLDYYEVEVKSSSSSTDDEVDEPRKDPSANEVEFENEESDNMCEVDLKSESD